MADSASSDHAYLHDPELHAIFLEELTQRAAVLHDGAARLTEEDPEDQYEVLIREGHTLKGNAGVMGFPDIAMLARAVEGCWRALQSGATAVSPEVAKFLGEAADLLPKLVEPTAILTARARALTTKLEMFRPGGEPRTTSSAADHRPAPQAAPPDQPAPPILPAQPEPPPLPEVGDQVLTGEPEDLGGLVSSLERRIIGVHTRVDTAELYGLINAIAEVRLATQSLSTSPLASPEAISLHRAVEELQRKSLELAAIPLREVTDAFPQLVRYLGRRTGKQVRLELEGVDVHVDRQILDHLREPLRHLVVNAVDHGLEPPDEREAAGKPEAGLVAIRAAAIDGRLRITVEDDGRGIDWARVAEVADDRRLLEPMPSRAELAKVLFRRDFSTLSEPTDLSGDGLGLAVVAEFTEMLNGVVSIESRPGEGASVAATLPISWALQDVTLIRAETKTWGIPAAAIAAVVPLSAADVRPGDDRMVLVFQGHEQIPICSFAAAVGLPEVEAVTDVVVLATRSGRVAVTVPEVIGRRQVAVKGLGPLLGGTSLLVGAAFLGGGDLAVILEPTRLADRVRTVPAPVTKRARVLVVDDSMGVRQLVSAALASHGFETLVAADASEALGLLSQSDFDALVVDYAMPDQSGVDLIKTVRQRSISIPIVMVSAVASPEDQAAAWQAGIDAYLDKFDLRKGALASTLRSLVPLRSPRRE